MKLHEIQDPSKFAAQWLNDHWTRKNGSRFELELMHVTGDEVNYNGHVLINGVTELPFKFGEVAGSLRINQTSNARLTSMKNMPHTVHGTFRIYENDVDSLVGMPSRIVGDCLLDSVSITTLEGVTENLDGSLELSKASRLTDLKGIHKRLKHLNGTVFLPPTIASHLLGVILINGFEGYSFIEKLPPELQLAMNIVNKHARYADKSRRVHLLDAQQELLDAGLDDFAQL